MRERTSRAMHSAARPGPISVDQAVLRGLSVSKAVEAFRDLLWARAGEQGIPVTAVSIPGDVSHLTVGWMLPSLRAEGPKFQDDELLSSGRRFQIKTGDFKPWQPATIKRELFGAKPKKFENLGEAIQRTLREAKNSSSSASGLIPSMRSCAKPEKTSPRISKHADFQTPALTFGVRPSSSAYSSNIRRYACVCEATTIKGFVYGPPGRPTRTCSP